MAIVHWRKAMPKRAWPKSWSKQELLLRAQHARLESAFAEVLAFYRSYSSSVTEPEAFAYEGLCRRLLWWLKLHQRLEERWLKKHDCLSTGHQADHQELLQTAFVDYCKTANNPKFRFAWLNNLQTSLSGHIFSTDAYDYSFANSKS